MKRTRGKPPLETFTVNGDAFVVVQNGEEYLPHADEHITFKNRIPMSLVEAIYKIQSGDMGQVAAGFGILADMLINLIVEWTWTDENGTPLPLEARSLWSLDQNEWMWIIGQLAARTEPGPNSNAP